MLHILIFLAAWGETRASPGELVTDALSVEVVGSRLRLWGHSKLNSVLGQGPQLQLKNGNNIILGLKKGEETAIVVPEMGSFYITQPEKQCPFLLTYVLGEGESGWTAGSLKEEDKDTETDKYQNWNTEEQKGWVNWNDGSKARTVADVNPLELVLQSRSRIFLTNAASKSLRISCLSFDDNEYKVSVTAVADYKSQCGSSGCGTNCPAERYGVDCSGVMYDLRGKGIDREFDVEQGGRAAFFYQGEEKGLEVDSDGNPVTLNSFQYSSSEMMPGFLNSFESGKKVKLLVNHNALLQVLNIGKSNIKVNFDLHNTFRMGLVVGLAVGLGGGGTILILIIILCCCRKRIRRNAAKKGPIRFKQLPYSSGPNSHPHICSSCGLGFLEGENVIYIESCEHPLHPNCFVEAAHSFGECPQCRRIRKEQPALSENLETIPVSPATSSQKEPFQYSQQNLDQLKEQN